MRLNDLLVTLPSNTRIIVHVAGDDCPVNVGAVNQFLAAGEFLDAVVAAMIPGTTLTIDCRHPDRRRMRHVQILTANRPTPAKVVSIRRGIRRHAPAGMFGPLSDNQSEHLISPRYREEYCWSHEPELDPQDLADTDIYRQILHLGGIQPSPAYHGEYRDDVPIGLRRRNGLPIDEMADMLHMNVNDMLEALMARSAQHRNTKGRRHVA